MQKPQQSNYDKLSETWREKFLQMDQEALMRKLPEIKAEGEYLTVLHFGRKYGIHRKDGYIKAMEDSSPISNGTRMNIYNLFWYSKENVSFADRWVPFRNVKNAGPFAPAFERNILKPFAMTFAGKTRELKYAAEKMGGRPVRQGDAGYILNAFSCIPMQYLFWDQDEEFPAQGNILFDYSVTDFIHVESTVTLAEEGIIRLAELAGAELKGKMFAM